MKRYISILILAVLILNSCDTKKKAVGAYLKNLTVDNVSSLYQRSNPEFETLTARLYGGYETKNEDNSITLNLRMKKDEVIWVSARFLGVVTVAKIMITPDRVQFYEKINKQYFDGDFSLLSNWLGMDLDFEKLQNLLLGRAVYDLKKNQYDLKISEAGYQLFSTDYFGVEKTLLIDKLNFLLKGQQLKRPLYNQNVTITYSEFLEVENRTFPKQIDMMVNQHTDVTKINISYRSIELNASIGFPFEFPNGYDQIVLK